jgi:hypothetical protein
MLLLPYSTNTVLYSTPRCPGATEVQQLAITSTSSYSTKLHHFIQLELPFSLSLTAPTWSCLLSLRTPIRRQRQNIGACIRASVWLRSGALGPTIRRISTSTSTSTSTSSMAPQTVQCES